MLFKADESSVAAQDDRLAHVWRDLMLVDDLDGGPRRMRWRCATDGRMWLPQEAKEENAQYHARLNRSTLYPGLTDALDRAVSKPFSRKVTLQELPPGIEEEWFANIDGEGNDLTLFARAWMRSAIKHGQAHMLVDFTNTGDKTARPFWKLLPHSEVIGWDEITLPDGSRGLGELRFREFQVSSKGYRRERREFIRVLRLNSFELWENMAWRSARDNEFYEFTEDRNADFKLVDSGEFGTEGGFEQLPVVTLYTDYRGFMQARPAFIDLAELNLTHFQSASDQRNILHVARVPILFAQGFAEDETKKGLVVGAGALVSSREAGAQLSYVEHSGAAIEAGANDLNNLEMLIQALGSRPLIERTGDVTATQSAISEAGNTTDIQCWIAAQEAALKHGLRVTTRWLGMDEESVADVKVDIFSDFAVVLGANDDLTALRAMRDKGDLSQKTYLREVKRRGLLADDVDVDEEIESLAEEGESAETPAPGTPGPMMPMPSGKPGEPVGGMPKDAGQREAE